MGSTYRINEIFYSLQGEGFFTGTASVFIRFSGCNLECPFCDTRHEEGTEMSARGIIEAISSWPSPHVVLTGGEPSLFIDRELVEALHGDGRFTAIETNGTNPLPEGIDWITYSPKQFWLPEAEPAITECDELKVVYTGQDLSRYSAIKAAHRFIQPCDTGDGDRNRKLIEESVEFCMRNPQWRLSLQTHKFIDIK